jgi:hypothetical protein
MFLAKFERPEASRSWRRERRVEQHETSEREVIARINRYSKLRAAERAIEPSVRVRRDLPTAILGRDLLVDLRKASQIAREGGADPIRQTLIAMVEEIDETLVGFALQLKRIINQTPMIQLRASLPAIAEQFRVEAVALLEVCLEADDIDDCPMLLVDFLITLLSTSQGAGIKAVSSDPCIASQTVERFSNEWLNHTSEENELLAAEFRNAAVEVLNLEDLERLVKKMREKKRPLRYKYFHPEILRSIVAYNLAVANRFKIVINQSRERDRALEEALGNLRALDEPGSGPNANRGLQDDPSGDTIRAEEPQAHSNPGRLEHSLSHDFTDSGRDDD